MARPTKQERRANQAKELLKNETLNEIFDGREREIFERWKSSETTDEREICYHDYIALGELRDVIDATARGDENA